MNSAAVKAITSAPESTLNESSASAVASPTAKCLMSPWVLMGATCLLLATSGGIRFWRESQFETIARENEKCPFALNEFPKILGTWHMDEGANPKLDPRIARIAGANAYLLRNYVDRESGAVVLVLILYGTARSVFGHSPEVCYPANGYQLVMPPANHQFLDPTSQFPVHFRSAFFSKNIGATDRYEEVYYTFHHNEQWLPEVADQWKSFRYHPGMFKILLQRPTTDLSTENSPTESLLRDIVREVNVRIAQSKTLTPSAMTPGKTAAR